MKATTARGVAYGDDMTFTTMPEGGALSFATTTLSINQRNSTGQLNTFPVSIHRRGGTDGEVAVEVTALPPATVPKNSIKYVYGTHYVFATETSAGRTVAVFNDGSRMRR